FTGASAGTEGLVRHVLAFARACPGRWAFHAGALADCEAALRDALERAARMDDEEPRIRALDAVRRGAAAMGALGAEAEVGIVTPDLLRACAVASAAGAAAKPSGAGGGDCAVVLAFGDAVLERTAERLAAEGLHVLRV